MGGPVQLINELGTPYGVKHTGNEIHTRSKLVDSSGNAIGESGNNLVTETQLVDESGTAYGVKHVGNKPRVSAVPYLYDIAEGNISGHCTHDTLGYNTTIGTTLEDITESGINVPRPATALAMEIISSDAADVGALGPTGTVTSATATTLTDTSATFVSDGVVAGDVVVCDEDASHGTVLTVDSETTITFDAAPSVQFSAGESYRFVDVSAGGTGAQAIIIHYLDSSWEEQEEFILLNGTTAVSTVNTMVRVNGVHTLSVGSGGVTAGNVDVRQVAAPANIMNRVAAGGNVALEAHYTVPLGKTGYIVSWSASASGTKAVRFLLRATSDDEGHRVPGVFNFKSIMLLEGDAGTIPFMSPIKIPEKTDIKVSANALAPSGEGAASFEFWTE